MKQGLSAASTLFIRTVPEAYRLQHDKYGFEYMLSRARIEVSGKKALILGSGGTSKTANAALAGLGAREIVTISRAEM
jgi:shikimate dehydrogenase